MQFRGGDLDWRLGFEFDRFFFCRFLLCNVRFRGLLVCSDGVRPTKRLTRSWWKKIVQGENGFGFVVWLVVGLDSLIDDWLVCWIVDWFVEGNERIGNYNVIFTCNNATTTTSSTSSYSVNIFQQQSKKPKKVSSRTSIDDYTVCSLQEMKSTLTE